MPKFFVSNNQIENENITIKYIDGTEASKEIGV
mgnify:CR=1 FL=1